MSEHASRANKSSFGGKVHFSGEWGDERDSGCSNRAWHRKDRLFGIPTVIGRLTPRDGELVECPMCLEVARELAGIAFSREGRAVIVERDAPVPAVDVRGEFEKLPLTDKPLSAEQEREHAAGTPDVFSGFDRVLSDWERDRLLHLYRTVHKETGLKCGTVDVRTRKGPPGEMAFNVLTIETNHPMATKLIELMLDTLLPLLRATDENRRLSEELTEWVKVAGDAAKIAGGEFQSALVSPTLLRAVIDEWKDRLGEPSDWHDVVLFYKKTIDNLIAERDALREKISGEAENAMQAAVDRIRAEARPVDRDLALKAKRIAAREIQLGDELVVFHAYPTPEGNRDAMLVHGSVKSMDAMPTDASAPCQQWLVQFRETGRFTVLQDDVVLLVHRASDETGEAASSRALDVAHNLWIAWTRGRLDANVGLWARLEAALRECRPVVGDFLWMRDPGMPVPKEVDGAALDPALEAVDVKREARFIQLVERHHDYVLLALDESGEVWKATQMSAAAGILWERMPSQRREPPWAP